MHGPFKRCMAQSKAARSAQNSGTDESTTSFASSNSASALLFTNPERTGGKILSSVPHHVNFISERSSATKRMAVEAVKFGPCDIISKCVKNFPSYFTGIAQASIQKAIRWLKKRESTYVLRQDGYRSFSFVIECTGFQ